jgi:hypothetical protein
LDPTDHLVCRPVTDRSCQGAREEATTDLHWIIFLNFIPVLLN